MLDADTVSRFTSLACGSMASMSAMPCAIVLAVPPVSWMLKVCSSGPSLSCSAPMQRADLVRLAAEADHEHASEVRVTRVARERAPEHLHALAMRVHSAARAVRERDHAVDIGKRREALAREVAGDAARHRGGAVHRGQDADVVARGDAAAIGAVLAHDALEGGGGRDVVRGLGIGAEGVVALELAHREIVEMHVLAGRDVAAGEADDLVVAAHRRAGLDRARGDLVAGRDEPGDGDVLVEQSCAAHELGARDHDIVGGMEADDERASGQHDVL